MPTSDPLRQLAEMRTSAFRLGQAFAAGAEGAQDLDRKLQLFDAFHRSFASVRLAIVLELRLKKGLPNGREREAERADPERDPPEQDRPERLDYTERDRDRETERASLPLLLRTLERVAVDAETLLPGPPPAELPSLRELLARVKGKAPEPTAAPLRTRLAGSATAALARPAVGAPPRRATGPP
jgi:hypothetical protein